MSTAAAVGVARARLLPVSALVCVLGLAATTAAHGRLIEPPSRASMWRYGFKTTPDYNDHESYCGGFTRQWVKNNGSCGICGDAWDLKQPRSHEAGGKFGQGIIVRRYARGATITIRVEITANHRGHFEFRLCKHNAPKKVATQQCLDRNVLRRARPLTDGGEQPHPSWYYIGSENKVYEVRYLLPPDVTCTQCVLQWRYVAANNWGRCSDLASGVGCGPQEEFRACADVAVEDADGGADETPHEDEGEAGEKAGADENYGDRLLLPAFVITIGMVVSVFVFVVLFVYYYGVNETVKPCWRTTLRRSEKTCAGVGQPMRPPRKNPPARVVVAVA